MIFLAVDPSFSRTGMVLLDTEAKRVIFNYKSPPGKNSDYNFTIIRGALITKSILELIHSYDNIKVVYEEPLVNSLKASGLGVLSGILAVSFGAVQQIESVYTIRPTAVSQVNSIFAANNKNITKKQISLLVVRQLIEMLESSYGYSVEYRTDKFNKDGQPKYRVLTHDEADAAYMLILLLKNLQVIPQDILNRIYEINPGFRKNILVNKLNK